MEKIKSGIPGLDKMLHGGIPKGRTLLVSGHCGSGKTIFGTQFITEGYKINEPGVYVTLEQGKEKLFEDSLEIGIDFKKMQKKNKVKVIGGSIGRISKFKFKTNANIHNLLEEINEVIEEVKAKRVVVDSINLFAMLFAEESDRRNAVAMLIAMLEDSGCTTILTCEIPENSKNISWYGFEDFVVDGVIKLHRKSFEGAYQRAISIIKMRGINHEKNIRAIQIKNKGMVIYDQGPDFIQQS